MPWFRMLQFAFGVCLSCNCNIQVFPSVLRVLTYIHSPHKNLSRKSKRTPICLTCQVAKVLEGHTLGLILLPIIDDLDKYLFAIWGSSSRSLGVPVSLWLIWNWRSVKGKKNEQKGGRRKVFFFWPCCFQVWDKSCNPSYERILSKYYLVFIGVIRKLFIRPWN